MKNTKKKITWTFVPNTVSERMIDSSLIHKLVPYGKIRRRTKVLNNIINSVRIIPSYSHYVKIKKNVLKEMSDDSDTDLETALDVEDFKQIYSKDIAEYNKSMSMCNTKTTTSSEQQNDVSYVDYTNVYNVEPSQYNGFIHLVSLIPNRPKRVQPKRASREVKLTENNTTTVSKRITRNPINNVRLRKRAHKKVVMKNTQKRVVIKKPTLRKIAVKGSKHQKRPEKIRTRASEHKNLGWQTIVKRKHMPRSIILPSNDYQRCMNETKTVNTKSLQNTGQEVTQASTTGEIYTNNKENICTKQNDLQNNRIQQNSAINIMCPRDECKKFNVKKNLITMWENFTSYNPRYMQPNASNLASNSVENNLQHSELMSTTEQQAAKLSNLLSNNNELVQHPKDSGIDDDSQEESGDGTVNSLIIKGCPIFQMQENLNNGDTSGLAEAKNNEKVQDPLKLDNLEESQKIVNCVFQENHDQVSCKTENVDPLGDIPANSVTFTDIEGQYSESDDNTKPTVMHTQIVNKKYKIVPTQSLEEINFEVQSPKASVVNTRASTCTLLTISKCTESSDSDADHETIINHKFSKDCLSSTNSRSLKSSRSCRSSKHSASSSDTKNLHHPNISRSSTSSSKDKDLQISDCESNVQNLKFQLDSKSMKICQDSVSPQDSQSTKSLKFSEYRKPSEHLDLSNNAEDSDSSVCRNSNKSPATNPFENFDRSHRPITSRTHQNIETTKCDTIIQDSANVECYISFQRSQSSVIMSNNTELASPCISESLRRKKDLKWNTDNSSKYVKNTNTHISDEDLKCDTSACSKILKTPEHIETFKPRKYARKLQECNKTQQLVKHEKPATTNSRTLQFESEECETESIAWIEDSEYDENNEFDTMSPTTTRKLQQLRRLNLTAGSDTDSSEDEMELFQLQYIAPTKLQECNKTQQLVKHDNPATTNSRIPQFESEECETESIAWIEDSEYDENNEFDTMSPTTTRKLQQLRRLNLTTGSDTDSSEDEMKLFQLQYIASTKLQECNKTQQLVKHDNPPTTNSRMPQLESEECETESIAWIEDSEYDENNDFDTMSPTTARKLQQLRRLNLTTGSDTDSSEDEMELFQLQYIASDDNSSFNGKSEKEEESNIKDENEEILQSFLQPISTNNQDIFNNHHSEKFQSNDWVDTTVCQGSRPDASSTIDRKKKNRKNRKRDSVQEPIAHFSPIASVYGSNSDKVIKTPSPTFDDYHDAFLPSSTMKSHAHINKSSLPLKKRPTSLGASTATPTEEDSLRYVLNTLKKKNIRDGELIDCTEEVENTKNHSSAPNISTQGEKSHPKRPQNLQQLIDREELEEVVTSDVLFKSNDVSDDDEVFVLNIPVTVNLNNLEGMRMVVKKNKLKIGTDRYEATYKSAEPISCVIRTGKKRRRYKTINIRPTGSIIVRGRIPCTTLLSKTEVKTEEDCNEENTIHTRPAAVKGKKNKKRGRCDSPREQICMQNKTKKLKVCYDDETE